MPVPPPQNAASDPAAPTRSSLRATRRLALYAGAVCVLAVVAAAVSFWRGSWIGVVWILLAGISSNMAWYYGRRLAAARRADRSAPADGGAPGGCAADARTSAEATAPGEARTSAEAPRDAE